MVEHLERLTRLAAVIAAVLVAACGQSEPSRPTPSPGPSAQSPVPSPPSPSVSRQPDAFATRSARSLQPPSIPPDTCPVAPVVEISPFVAPASGTGPVYAVLGAAEGRFDITDTQLSSFERYPMKTLWVATDPADERVLIRVVRVDGRSATPGFATGAAPDAEGLATQLRLGPEGSIGFEGEPEGWRAWSSTTLVPGVGCYAFQVDTARTTQTLVFEVVK